MMDIAPKYEKVIVDAGTSRERAVNRRVMTTLCREAAGDHLLATGRIQCCWACGENGATECSTFIKCLIVSLLIIDLD